MADRNAMIRRVNLAMPDQYPDSFATHVVDKFLADGTTDNPEIDRFLQALCGESS